MFSRIAPYVVWIVSLLHLLCLDCVPFLEVGITREAEVIWVSIDGHCGVAHVGKGGK